MLGLGFTAERLRPNTAPDSGVGVNGVLSVLLKSMDEFVFFGLESEHLGDGLDFCGGHFRLLGE